MAPEASVTRQPEVALLAVGSGRRLVLTAEALWMESRGAPGDWVRTRAVPFDEVRAAYAYELRDWGLVGAGVLAWLTLLSVAAAAAGVAGWGRYGMAFLVGGSLFTLALAGLVGWRVATVKRSLLRVEAYSGVLEVPLRDIAFFTLLTHRLAAYGESAAASAAPETPAGTVSPSWAPPAGGAPPPPPPPGAPPGGYGSPSSGSAA
jgi:hypothetical protein